MIPRYSDDRIAAIWADEAKLRRWDYVEIAVIQARRDLGIVSVDINQTIHDCLVRNQADIAWWKSRDKEIHHDLNAYLDERRRHIPTELQHLFHQDMTSYDTEEAALARALDESSEVVLLELQRLHGCLCEQASKYRQIPMLDRTHGQGAKLCSFGGRLLTYIAELAFVREKIGAALRDCKYSRISGTIGNYGGGMTPEIERVALESHGLRPFYGSTQILPRVIHATLAQALQLLTDTLGKMALDFRLGARSGLPLWHEPFGKKQKGSSAMPHKKNTILTEQMEGFRKMARSAANALVDNIVTWERRSIEQSCVERIEWPNLFHMAVRMLTVMQKVMGGMVVYPQHMLQEIIDSRCTYASDEAKNFLAKMCTARGHDAEVAYRIVQLASFNAIKEGGYLAKVKLEDCGTIADWNGVYLSALEHPAMQYRPSIRKIIREGRLVPSEDLEATQADVDSWNAMLSEIFASDSVREEWKTVFSFEHLLRNEPFLFEMIIGA